jgi:hypothetical protein
MQIKPEHPKKINETPSLVSQWLAITIPWVASVILLPNIFLLVGWMYLKEYLMISATTLLTIITVQSVLILMIALITAWVILCRLSQHMQTVSRVITTFTTQPEKKIIFNDEWITIEKQENDLGQTARQIRQFVEKEPDLMVLQAENPHQIWHQEKEPVQDPLQTLFVMSFQESETSYFPQVY